MWDVSISGPTTSLNHGRSTPVGIRDKETTTIFCTLPECASTMFFPSPPQPCQEPIWGPCEHPQSCRSWEPACEALHGNGEGSGCLRGAEQPHCSSDGAQPPAAHHQKGDVLPAGNWGCKSGCPPSLFPRLSISSRAAVPGAPTTLAGPTVLPSRRRTSGVN